MIRRIAGCSVLAAALACALHASAAWPATAETPCRAPAWSQFDFWLGTWDLRWDALPDTPAGKGRNRVAKILDGCVVEENFTSDEADPLVGRSLSTWNPERKAWLQTWVDNQGSYLDFVGEWKDGRMVLARQGVARDGAPAYQRMTFENIRADALDWRWETSRDGKTWSLRWLIHYQRAR